MQKLKCDMDNMVMFGWVSNLKKNKHTVTVEYKQTQEY